MDLEIRRDSVPGWKVILFKVSKDPIVLPNVLVTTEEVETYFDVSENVSH